MTQSLSLAVLFAASFLGTQEPAPSKGAAIGARVEAKAPVLMEHKAALATTTFVNFTAERQTVPAKWARGGGLHFRAVELAPGVTDDAAKLRADFTDPGADPKGPYELPPGASLSVTIDLREFAKLAGKVDVGEVWFEDEGVKSEPIRVDLVEDLSKTIVVLETAKGEMRLQLDPTRAPLACRNFVRHVQLGTYDGTLFHRVMANFMAQGGDPNSRDAAKPDSWGGGGAPFNGRYFHAEIDRSVKFERGTLAMARNGDPMASYGQLPLQQILQASQQGDRTAQLFQARIVGLMRLEGVNLNDMGAVEARYQLMQKQKVFGELQPFLDSQGSQFFVCFGRVEHLEGNYIGFGKLISGDDTLAKIEAGADPTTAGTNGRPKEPVKLTKARLEKAQ